MKWSGVPRVSLLATGVTLALIAVVGTVSPTVVGAARSATGTARTGTVSAVATAASPLQLVQDPSFAATTESGGTFTNPYWTQSSSGGFGTIDDTYHTATGYSDGDNYSADLCGYGNCTDRVDQGGYVAHPPVTITVPDNVTSATLSFEMAVQCNLVSTSSCSGSELRVGLWEPSTGQAVEQDFWSSVVPGGEVEYPPQQYSLNTAAFLQARPGRTIDVYAIAAAQPGDGTEWYVDAIQLAVTALPSPPGAVTAVSGGAGSATVSWTEAGDAAADGVTGYAVTTYNAHGQQVGSTQTVSGAGTTSTTVSGLSNGTPFYFSVAAVNSVGTGAPAESYSVTPLSASAPGAATTAVSTLQYLLPNSDGSTWQVMDQTNLGMTVTPSGAENVLLSANSDLWTQSAGYNQDLGIEIIPGGGSPVYAAWKESGGFAGTFSPNAAFVETVYPMSGGTTYTIYVVWKTNRPAIGATIAAAAGPIGAGFSPTRLTADVLPAGSQSSVSTQQYHLAGSDGSTWAEMDPSRLTATLAPSVTEDAVISGNSDLWTANAGYNQDLGIMVSEDGGAPTLLAWKESGGFAGTFSPNAAFVQTVYPMTAGHSYVFSLWWKTNKPASGATVYAGAGQTPTFSPTRITAYALPTNSSPTQWASTASAVQYHLAGSDGSTWQALDSTDLATTIAVAGGGSSETVLVSGNSDLWTASAGYNQDLGILVSTDGATPTLLAWKESGGFAGTFSPNAAYVQAVFTMTPGHSYVFSLAWKTNKPASGATVYAGAGPIGTAYSPTRLTIVPQM